MTAAALSTWRLPDLASAPEGADWWNALNSHLGQPIALPGGAVLLAEAAEAPAPEAAALHLQGEREVDAVAVPVSFPFQAQFGADLTVADLPVLPGGLRDGLLEGIARFTLAALSLEPLGEVAVTRQGPAGELAPARARWFRVTLGGIAPEPIITLLGVEPAVLEFCFGAGLVPAPVWGEDVKRWLTRDADLTLGRLRVSVAALRGLPPGAMVLMEAAAADEARLRVGPLLFAFRATDQGWMCDTVKDLDAPARSQAVEGEDAVNDLSGLDIAVDFDLGRLQVPLAQLESWQPGSLVRLDLPDRESVAVTLRVNGRAVGSGDLVRIDDRPAVRITRLNFGR